MDRTGTGAEHDLLTKATGGDGKAFERLGNGNDVVLSYAVE